MEKNYLKILYIFKICIAFYLLYHIIEVLILTITYSNNQHSRNLLGLNKYDWLFYSIDIILIFVICHWVFRLYRSGYPKQVITAYNIVLANIPPKIINFHYWHLMKIFLTFGFGANGGTSQVPLRYMLCQDELNKQEQNKQ